MNIFILKNIIANDSLAYTPSLIWQIYYSSRFGKSIIVQDSVTKSHAIACPKIIALDAMTKSHTII